MWTKAFLGLGCGAALARALLVLEWKVRYKSNSPTKLIHAIFHPMCILVMRTLRFGMFRGVLTHSNVLKLNAVVLLSIGLCSY